MKVNLNLDGSLMKIKVQDTVSCVPRRAFAHCYIFARDLLEVTYMGLNPNSNSGLRDSKALAAVSLMEKHLDHRIPTTQKEKEGDFKVFQIIRP